jgi:hypothetical protein
MPLEVPGRDHDRDCASQLGTRALGGDLSAEARRSPGGVQVDHDDATSPDHANGVRGALSLVLR